MKKLVILLFFAQSCHSVNITIPRCDTTNPKLRYINCKAWDLCSLDESFIAMIASALKPEIFLETGTFNGDTTDRASRYIPLTHTIELGEELYEKAKKRFSTNKNIILHLGDSAQVLPSLMPILNSKTLFFLDAHFSGGSSVKGLVNTPILNELETIKKSGINDAIILVDDTRMFYTPMGNVENTIMDGYPTLDQIIVKIQEINPNYTFALLADDLIAFVCDEQITISPIVQATTISRLYDGQNFDINEVMKAELVIANAQGSERSSIQLLAEYCTENWSRQAGLSRHYPLWYGLILLANKEYEKAAAYLMEAKLRGMDHWRIDWYISMAQAKSFYLE